MSQIIVEAFIIITLKSEGIYPTNYLKDQQKKRKILPLISMWVRERQFIQVEIPKQKKKREDISTVLILKDKRVKIIIKVLILTFFNQII